MNVANISDKTLLKIGDYPLPISLLARLLIYIPSINHSLHLSKLLLSIQRRLAVCSFPRICSLRQTSFQSQIGRIDQFRQWLNSRLTTKVTSYPADATADNRSHSRSNSRPTCRA